MSTAHHLLHGGFHLFDGALEFLPNPQVALLEQLPRTCLQQAINRWTPWGTPAIVFFDLQLYNL